MVGTVSLGERNRAGAARVGGMAEDAKAMHVSRQATKGVLDYKVPIVQKAMRPRV